MRDPHVKALHYCLVHDNSVDYEKAEPLDEDFGAFRARLDRGEAVFEMKAHHATEEPAREVVDPFTSACEIAG